MPTFAEYDTSAAVVVKHLATNTVLGNVQVVTISQGRSNLSDSYRSASATVEGRFPDDLPNIKIGDLLKFTLRIYLGQTLQDSTVYTYRVADVTLNYGSTAKLDTWSIQLEDAFAFMGRATLDLTVTAGTLAITAAEDICDAVGVTFTAASPSLSTTTVNAQTFTNANALDAFQTYANTELAFVVQQGDQIQWTPRAGWTNQGSITTFTDDPSSYTDYLRIQGLEFSSLADTVADEVVVNVRGGSTYTSGTGNTSVSFDSYSGNAAEGQGLADFVKVLFTDDEPQPYRLEYLLDGQNPAEVLYPVEAELRQIDIDFRGTVYTAVVLGFTLTITPGRTRASLNLLSKQQIPFLVLNDPSFGILGTNVLAW